jgi:hypothetical protein
MKLCEPDKVAFETDCDSAMDYCEAQENRSNEFWKVLETDVFGVDDPPEDRPDAEIMEAHRRIRKDTLEFLAKYADAIAQKRTFPLPSGFLDEKEWERVKFILAFDTSFTYFPEDEDGSLSDNEESDYLDYETTFRYDVVKACERLTLEGAALAKQIGSGTYGLWTAAMIKLGDRSEKIQYKAADDMVNALIQTWADLDVWIFMNTPHNNKKRKSKTRKSKK